MNVALLVERNGKEKNAPLRKLVLRHRSQFIPPPPPSRARPKHGHVFPFSCSLSFVPMSCFSTIRLGTTSFPLKAEMPPFFISAIYRPRSHSMEESVLERNDHHHHQEKKVGGPAQEQVQGGQEPPRAPVRLPSPLPPAPRQQTQMLPASYHEGERTFGEASSQPRQVAKTEELACPSAAAAPSWTSPAAPPVPWVNGCTRNQSEAPVAFAAPPAFPAAPALLLVVLQMPGEKESWMMSRSLIVNTKVWA